LGATSFLVKPMDFGSSWRMARACAGQWVWLESKPPLAGARRGTDLQALSNATGDASKAPYRGTATTPSRSQNQGA
jgi:hypothetical protein